MPPLVGKLGAHHSYEGAPDFDVLMEQARRGEFDVLKVVGEEGDSEPIYLFDPAGEIDETDIVMAAIDQGVLRGTSISGERILTPESER